MRSAILIAVSAVLALVAGCGQRGDLYFSDNPPPGVKPHKAKPYTPVPYPKHSKRDSSDDQNN